MTTLKTSFNQSASHRKDKKFLLILLGLNILSFAATILVYSITQTTLEREKQKIFEQDAEKIQQLVEERMLNHVNTLRGLQAFWIRNPEGLTAAKFKLYLDSINLFYDHPSVSSVSFVKKDSDRYINSLVEPESVRAQTLGFDHNAIPERKQYFDRAMNEGEIISAWPVDLITTKKSGIFLIAPVYSGGLPRSLADRKAKLSGFIVMVFRDDNLFTAIFGRQNPLPDIDFVVYHSPENILFDSDPEFNPAVYPDLLQTEKYVTIGKTPWTIVVTAKPSFSLTSAEEKLPLIILIVGLAFSTALGLIIIYFYRQHLKTWH